MNVKVFRRMSLLLVLLMAISCINVSVYATDTQILTKTQIRQYGGTPQEAQNMLNRYISDAKKYPWKYSDASCEGTLYFTGQYRLVKQTELGTGYYLYEWELTYSGTVTIKVINSKEAVNKIVYRGAGSSTDYYNFLRNIRNTSINYDDGTFKGTLYYNSQYIITYKSVSQFGPTYYWEVEVTYKGTVYKK